MKCTEGALPGNSSSGVIIGEVKSLDAIIYSLSEIGGSVCCASLPNKGDSESVVIED